MKTETLDMPENQTPTAPFWNKGPALGGGGTAGPCTERWPSGLWGDGDTLLIAVEVTNRKTEDTRWEYAAVSISCDQHYFEVNDMSTGEGYDDWDPASWSWWARVPSLPNVKLTHDHSTR